MKVRSIGDKQLISNQDYAAKSQLQANHVRRIVRHTLHPLVPFYQDPETEELMFEVRIIEAFEACEHHADVKGRTEGFNRYDNRQEAQSRGDNDGKFMRAWTEKLRELSDGLWTSEQSKVQSAMTRVGKRRLPCHAPQPWPAAVDEPTLFEDADISIKALIAANLSRVERWHSLASWSVLEWAGAMCGEAGEAANSAKKLKRVEDNIANNDARTFGLTLTLQEQLTLYRRQIGMEAADTIIYSILLCARAEVDLVRCLREAFNAKSEEYGFPERL